MPGPNEESSETSERPENESIDAARPGHDRVSGQGPGSDDDALAGRTLEFSHSGERLRLDLFLCAKLPGRSRAFIQKLIDEGWIEIPNLPVSREIKSSSAVLDGFEVKVTLPPTRKSTIEPEPIPLDLIYEDEHLAAVDKPPDLVMHPSPHQVNGTLVNGLLYHLTDLSGIGGEERPGIVHRLDRYTSGVVIVAKDDLTHQLLSTQFKDRTIKKTYLAILRGQWTAREGTINLPIGRSFLNRKRMMVRTDGQGRDSVTNYRIEEDFDGYAFVRLKPETGRTHQIRVHMAKIRTPVACDALYGREQRIFDSELARRKRSHDEQPILSRQALHASEISFIHPIFERRMHFKSPLPADMQALLDALRKYRAVGTAP